MRVFMALVWREVLERRLLLVAGLFLGLVPVLAPWVPGRPERFVPEDIRTAGILILVVFFGGITLFILGSTILVRDLSEDRLSFFYSRPIPVWSLWLSRLAAACLLLVATLLLILIPTALLDFQSWMEQLSSSGPSRARPLLGFREIFMIPLSKQALPPLAPTWFRLSQLMMAVVAMLATAHTVSTAIRSRSLWVMVDFAGLAIVLTVGWAARNLLVGEEAVGALVHAERLLLPWLLGSLLVAGAVQLSRGRTDLQLGHRYLSATLWPLLIVGVLAFGAYAHWVVASELEDLQAVTFARTSPDEAWVVAGGPVRHRSGARAAFLRHTAGEQSWRLGSLRVAGGWLRFSRDSSTVAWLRCEGFSPLVCGIWTKDLTDIASPPRLSDVPCDRLPDQIALSPDGRRIALAGFRRIAVYELPSGNLVAAADARQPFSMSFVSSDRVRFQESIEQSGGARRLRIRHFDLTSRDLADAGLLPTGQAIWHSPHDDRVLYTGPSASSDYGLFDSATGQQLATLEERWRYVPKQGLILADGRLVVTFSDPGRFSLVIFSPQGEEVSRVELERVARAAFGGELSPDRLIVALLDWPTMDLPPRQHGLGFDPLPGWTTYVLDTETGELAMLAPGIVPLTRHSVAVGPRLFASRSAILRWDLETLEPQVLISPEKGLQSGNRGRFFYVPTDLRMFSTDLPF